MDYHWDDENAVIILDDEMSEFELADAQSERKLVKYVIGMIQPFSSVSVLDLYYLREKKKKKKEQKKIIRKKGKICVTPFVILTQFKMRVLFAVALVG